MIWSKSESEISPQCRKVTLERKTLWGKRQRKSYFEQALPPIEEQRPGSVCRVTRRRTFWRFRFWHPLESRFFVVSSQGKWVQVARSFA